MAVDPKVRQIQVACAKAKDRAGKNNVPFALTPKYLLSIAGDECPIFRTPFVWGQSKLGHGVSLENGPELDRIVPKKGYVEGNVAFISRKANRIKGAGTMVQHYAIADWIWEQTRARKISTTPVPAGHDREGEGAAITGAVHGAGPGQDSDSVDDHSGAIYGHYAYSGA